jgi:hypothetical protein
MRLGGALACAVLVASCVQPRVAGAQSAIDASAQSGIDAAAEVRAALAAQLDPDASRPVPRLAEVRMDSSGDTTVVFAIKNADDDAPATRAGALADTFTILRTVYALAPPGITSLTVLGTFPFQGTKGKSVRESPVLRAVLSQASGSQLDWDALSPTDVPAIVDVWWVQAAFANVGEPVPDAAPPVAASDVSPLRSHITLAAAHLDATLKALAAGEVGIGRSQFKQFFDAWDDVDQTVSELDPARYDLFDADLERAEVALLHTQPEDIPAAQAALSDLRTLLASLAQSAATED